MNVNLKAQIVRIENNQFSYDTTKLQGNVDLNFYTIKNANKFLKIGAGSQLKHSNKNNTFISINDLRLIVAGRNNLENKGFQHFRFQRKIDSSFTWELFTQIQFDQVLKIKLRQLDGMGPRMQFFRRSKTRMFLGILYMFEYEEEKESGIIARNHRISSYWTISRKYKKSTFHLITYYQPKITNFSDFRLSGSITLTIELTKHLFLNSNGELAYNSNPIMGVVNLNYTFVNGFSWKF